MREKQIREREQQRVKPQGVVPLRGVLPVVQLVKAQPAAMLDLAEEIRFFRHLFPVLFVSVPEIGGGESGRRIFTEKNAGFVIQVVGCRDVGLLQEGAQFPPGYRMGGISVIEFVDQHGTAVEIIPDYKTGGKQFLQAAEGDNPGHRFFQMDVNRSLDGKPGLKGAEGGKVLPVAVAAEDDSVRDFQKLTGSFPVFFVKHKVVIC